MLMRLPRHVWPPTENSNSTSGRVFTVVASPAELWCSVLVSDVTMRPDAVDQVAAFRTSITFTSTMSTSITTTGSAIRPTQKLSESPNGRAARQELPLPCSARQAITTNMTEPITMPSAHGGGPDRAGGAGWPPPIECQG